MSIPKINFASVKPKVAAAAAKGKQIAKNGFESAKELPKDVVAFAKAHPKKAGLIGAAVAVGAAAIAVVAKTISDKK